jgi:plastocyanin
MLLVAIPLLLTMAPAMAQTNMVYAGHTVELSVDQIPGDTYSWELYDNVTGVNFATDAGNCPQTDAAFSGSINSGPVVHATFFTAGTYYYKVTAQRSGCTMNLKVGKIIIGQPLSGSSLSLLQTSTCVGQPVNLMATLSGTGPWNITYRVTAPDGTVQDITLNNLTNTSNTIPFTPSASGTYTFQVISVTDKYNTNNTASNTVTLTMNAKPAGSRIYQYDQVNKKK